MRSLQIQLRKFWDFQDEEVLVPWTLQCVQDLLWWIQGDRLARGISLEAVAPDQVLSSDASDLGWGACLGSEVCSGLWSDAQRVWSINRRELHAILLGLQAFEGFLCNNYTAVV